MGLLLAVPLTAFIKLVADLHPSLCHLSNMLALTPRPTPRWIRYGETALERAIPSLRPPSWKSSCSALTLGDRELRVIDSGARCILGAPGVFIRLQSAIGLRSERQTLFME